MPINKFGLFERRNDDNNLYHWNELVRNYMRNNALCRVVIDAKSRKIRYVAQLEADTDAANKLDVEQCFKIVKNQQRESDDKLTAIEKDVRALPTNNKNKRTSARNCHRGNGNKRLTNG